MGVKGLETFANKKISASTVKVDLYPQLQGNVVVVDLPALEYHLLNSCPDGNFPGIGEGLDEALVWKLVSFFEFFQKMGILLVVVDDGGLNSAKTATQKSRSESDFVPIAKFHAKVVSLCGIDAAEDQIPKSSSFDNFYTTHLFPTLLKSELNRGTAQYVSVTPSMFHLVKQKLLKDLVDRGVIMDVIYTIHEADACLGNIARQGSWKGVPIAAVLSQDSDFLIFDVAYVPLQTLSLTPPSPHTPVGSLSGCLFPAGVFSSKMYDLGVAKLASVLCRGGESRGRALLRQACPASAFHTLLADLATIGTNDFYSPEVRACSMPSHVPLGALLVLIQQQLKVKGIALTLAAGGSIPLYTSSGQRDFSDFEGIAAFLLACVLAGLITPDDGLDLSHPTLRTLLFTKKSGATAVDAYTAARYQYNLFSDMALNQVPPRLAASGYAELYQGGRISHHQGEVLGMQEPRHRIVWHRKDNVRLHQFGFPALNVIEQQRLMLELKLTVGQDITPKEVCLGRHLEGELVSFRRVVKKGHSFEFRDDIEAVLLVEPADAACDGEVRASDSEWGMQQRRFRWLAGLELGPHFLNANKEVRKARLCEALGAGGGSGPHIAGVHLGDVVADHSGRGEALVSEDQLHMVLLAFHVMVEAQVEAPTHSSADGSARARARGCGGGDDGGGDDGGVREGTEMTEKCGGSEEGVEEGDTGERWLDTSSILHPCHRLHAALRAVVASALEGLVVPGPLPIPPSDFHSQQGTDFLPPPASMAPATPLPGPEDVTDSPHGAIASTGSSALALTSTSPTLCAEAVAGCAEGGDVGGDLWETKRPREGLEGDERRGRWFEVSEPREVVVERVRAMAMYLLYCDCLVHVQRMSDAFGGAVDCSHPLLLRNFERCQAHVCRGGHVAQGGGIDFVLALLGGGRQFKPQSPTLSPVGAEGEGEGEGGGAGARVGSRVGVRDEAGARMGGNASPKKAKPAAPPVTKVAKPKTAPLSSNAFSQLEGSSSDDDEA